MCDEFYVCVQHSFFYEKERPFFWGVFQVKILIFPAKRAKMFTFREKHSKIILSVQKSAKRYKFRPETMEKVQKTENVKKWTPIFPYT